MLNNYSIVKHGSKPTWISNEDSYLRLQRVILIKKADHILFKDIVPRNQR